MVELMSSLLMRKLSFTWRAIIYMPPQEMHREIRLPCYHLHYVHWLFAYIEAFASSCRAFFIYGRFSGERAAGKCALIIFALFTMRHTHIFTRSQPWRLRRTDVAASLCRAPAASAMSDRE